MADYFGDLFAGTEDELNQGDLMDYFTNSDVNTRLTAAFGSCDKNALTSRNSNSFGAELNCPGNSDSVGHGKDCSWSCDDGAFVKFGKTKSNSVECQDGRWRGLRRAVCVGMFFFSIF